MYFEIDYEDRDLRYPLIHSYEYHGLSADCAGSYEFRILRADGLLLIEETGLESMADADELAVLLKEWARRNPGLA